MMAPQCAAVCPLRSVGDSHNARKSCVSIDAGARLRFLRPSSWLEVRFRHGQPGARRARIVTDRASARVTTMPRTPWPAPCTAHCYQFRARSPGRISPNPAPEISLLHPRTATRTRAQRAHSLRPCVRPRLPPCPVHPGPYFLPPYTATSSERETGANFREPRARTPALPAKDW